MSEPEPRSEPLFSLTLYPDGTLAIDGHGKEDRLPDILRVIAEALESGTTRMARLEGGDG